MATIIEDGNNSPIAGINYRIVQGPCKLAGAVKAPFPNSWKPSSASSCPEMQGKALTERKKEIKIEQNTKCRNVE